MRALILLFLTRLVLTADGAQFVKYLLTHGHVPNKKGIKCIINALQGVHNAYRIEEASGDCVPLGSEWLADKTFLNGYSYLEPADVVQTPSTTAPASTTSTAPGQTQGLRPDAITQIFTQPNPIGDASAYEPKKDRVWTMPHKLGIGGSVEFYFTVPTTPGSWRKLYVRFQEGLDGYPFLNNDDVDDELCINLILSNDTNQVQFRTYDLVNAWTTAESWEPNFVMGQTYKIAINARETDYQIFIDDIERSTLSYIKSPDMVKVIVFKYMNTEGELWPWIENITFWGTW